jgi:hypothetical protein
MVLRKDKNGCLYHEPPYSEQNLREFDRGPTLPRRGSFARLLEAPQTQMPP